LKWQAKYLCCLTLRERVFPFLCFWRALHSFQRLSGAMNEGKIASKDDPPDYEESSKAKDEEENGQQKQNVLRPPSIKYKLGSSLSQESAGGGQEEAPLRSQSPGGVSGEPSLAPLRRRDPAARSAPNMDARVGAGPIVEGEPVPYRPLRPSLRQQLEGGHGMGSSASSFEGGGAGSRESVRSSSAANSETGYLGRHAPSSSSSSAAVIPRQQSTPETCHHLHSHHPHHYGQELGASTLAGPPISPPPASLSGHVRLPSYSSAAGGEAFASIAADTLRINGALRQFKQVKVGKFDRGLRWLHFLTSKS